MTLPKEVEIAARSLVVASNAKWLMATAEAVERETKARAALESAILAAIEDAKKEAGACHEEHVRCANELAEWRRAAVFRRDALEVIAEQAREILRTRPNADVLSLAEFAEKKAKETP